jgi:alpha-L-fucosidase
MTTYQPTLESLKQHPVPQWFHDAKFGIMVSWTLSSVPGWATPVGSLHEVTKKFGFEYWFKNNPYSEWYWNSLKIEGSPTRAYHAKTYGDNFPYTDFKELFIAAAAKWRPEPWADLFARIGAQYVVLITKHHDGFTLWQSAHPNPHCPDFHAGRDLVGELTDAVRLRGLRMGLYYSGGPDWWFQGDPITDLVSMANAIPQSDEYARYVDAHWRELIERYKPSIIWNDIGFPAKLDVKALYADYYNTIPDGVVNDRSLQADARKLIRSRLGRALVRWLLKVVLNTPGSGGIPKNIHADFTTPEYTSVSKLVAHKWEATRGLGYSFGYNQNETAGHMLSVEQLVRHLVDIVSKNGNLLLDVGPMADGAIPTLQLERLEGLGRWLSVNGEAIFATRPWHIAEAETADRLPVRFTQRGDSLYAILLDTPASAEVRFPSLKFKAGTTVQLLGGERPLSVDLASSTVRLPEQVTASPAYALKITPLPEAV